MHAQPWGRHRLRTFRIGYGVFVEYGQLYYRAGKWWTNNYHEGTIRKF